MSRKLDWMENADSFCEILSEAIGRLTTKDLFFSAVGSISICAIILASIYLIGLWKGIY